MTDDPARPAQVEPRCSCVDPRPLVPGAYCRRCHKPTTDPQHIDLSFLPAHTYVSFAQIGRCHVCGQEHDLRMGACFDCSDFVDGRLVDGVHELWDRRNPAIQWKVRDQ